MTAEPTPSFSSRSLAARLEARFGADVDPRVDLDSGRTLPPRVATVPSGSGTAASETLQRLGARRPVAARYRCDGEVARGGMGAILEVFDEDLRRRLAMKVILDRRSGSGAATPSAATTELDPTTLARFLEEAQVTGQLDHPGVVPVHELGLDDEGRLYFTMRLVHGRDLEAICALAARGEEGWHTTRVLGVLLKVCEAMAYAHQKGVVHRDLKPHNVMVGRFGEVYVMDWGLARVRGRAEPGRPRGGERSEPAVATDRDEARGTGSTPLTLDGDVVGTPSYMPPEQARGELEAIDERSDVYAVGAMMYRLLAGTAPFVQPGERASATTVWQRLLAGPPAPLESVAPEAPGELVAICAKAMAREPAARYPDMQALGEELRAFLEGRVVQAFATGAWATARKWVQRNKALAAALAAAVLALVVGLATSLVFADRARTSAALAEERRRDADRNAGLAETRRQEAEASARLAETRRSEADASAAAARRQASVAEAVRSFLNDDLLAALAPEHRGKDVTVREVLDLASTRLSLQFAEAPEVEAALRATIGTSYQRLGDYAAAAPHFDRALRLRRGAADADPEPVLQSLRSLAALQVERGDFAAAVASYEEALAIALEELGAEHRGTLSTRNDLGIALVRLGRADEARRQYETAVAAQQRTLGDDHEDTLSTRNNLALLDQRAGRFAAAEQALRQVVARRRAVLGERHPETVLALGNLANVLGDLGRLDEAQQLATEVLASRRAMHGDDHPLVGKSQNTLGALQHRRGQVAAAGEAFRDALRIANLHGAADAPDVLLAKHNLASALERPDQLDESLRLHREVLDARTRRLGADHIDTLESKNGLAARLGNADRWAEAEALYREALAGREQVLGAEHPSSIVTRENLGGALLSLGRHDESERMTREVLELRKRVLGDAHPDVARTLYNLTIVQNTRGDLVAARATVDEALTRSRAAFGDGHLQVALCLRTRGDLQRKQEAWQGAVDDYEAALRIRRALRPDDDAAAFLLFNAAWCRGKLQQHEAALPGFVAAQALYEASVGPDHRSSRGSLQQRVRALVELGRHGEAEPLALELWARTARTEGDASETRQRVRALLAAIYEGLGRVDEAAKWR